MESILARALEYTLKYWLKSFSRDQLKLQGRTVQLSNLDINGEALHASVGLPPALTVTTARVGKLEIKLPSVSNVQYEPIVVQIDRLDLVLEENSSSDTSSRSSTSGSAQSSTSSTKGSGYGFADKIADGMTLEVGTVNLLIETRGGAQKQGGAAWASPLASITIRNLLLYTTNENWEVVNLKEARYFSNNKKCIYVFKKLEWASLSIDLLPHPDMFTDANLTCSSNGGNKRDDDGANRVFFGGERFLEGISGQAYITVQRTELNSPLGLEVQLHFPEAVCPALSEPGLRAVLRFMTGLYVCINRDVDPNAQQATETAGRSLVSIVVDHIFLCIKDADFQLELLMQSLFFSRASVSDGANTKKLSKITVAGLFLRDTFSHPPCTLIQPSMQAVAEDALHVPDFGKNFCPPIYPLGNMRWQVNEGVPVICLHSLQMKPSPTPPSFASQTVIDCQPLKIHLQEESCLRIASFPADGIVVNPGDVLPDFSVNSLVFGLKEIDLTVPLDVGKLDNDDALGSNTFRSSFVGARLHVKDLFFSESPELKLRLLNLDKDPACFCLWEDQPVDASQLKWTARASQLSLSLETGTENKKKTDSSTGLWKCVELLEVCVEAAMVTADGSPLITVPPPGGIFRIGVSCLQCLSNTSVEQLFFVLDLYSYFGRVAEKISKIGKGNRDNGSIKKSLGGKLIEKFPSDTAVILAMQDLQLRFLESSSSINIEGMPLVLFNGEYLFIKVSHRTLGGAIAVSSNMRWESIQVDCVDGDGDGNLVHKNGIVGISSEDGLLVNGNGYPHMRTVFWIDNTGSNLPTGITSPIPFLDISMVQVIPYNAQDTECHSLSMSAKVGGVRLGGGMNYTEALLHRFGILGPDGGPSEGLSKGLKYLSNGPLSKLLRASPTIEDEEQESVSSENEEGGPSLELGKMPDDVDVSVELKNWLFALEGAQERAERWWFHDEDIGREDRCWHTMFQSLLVKAKSRPKNVENSPIISPLSQKYPVELVTVGVEGLQAIKPQTKKEITADGISLRGNKGTGNCGGVNFEVHMVSSESIESTEMPTWGLENVKFSIKQPIEAVATKEELEYLVGLCKSEGDSLGRIAAGILRLLKLDGSIGQAAIDQLSNLGSDGLDKIFSPEKLSRRSSTCSMGFTPITPTLNINESQHPSLESTVALLESAVSDSQSKCLGLISELDNCDCKKQQHLSEIRQLQQKLESMQLLLSRLRTQI